MNNFLLAELNNIKKYIGDRLLFDFDSIRIYSGDKIGVVGINGCGKTTFLNILTGIIKPDEGSVRIDVPFAFIAQLDSPHIIEAEPEIVKKYGVSEIDSESMSGGEATRLKIAQALSHGSKLFIADEPTSNLDEAGITQFKQELKGYDGGLVLVSHDRDFLDETCNKILEIASGSVKIYEGNYSAYKQLKDAERERAGFEYESYTAEKRRLEVAANEKAAVREGMRRTPKRMGNSEARLHRMGGQVAQKKLSNSVKNIEKRIEKLEVKQKPRDEPEIKIDLSADNASGGRIVVSGRGIYKSYGGRAIFKDAKFEVYKGSKTAVIGPNGSGKTTLLNMIVSGEAVVTSPSVKTGYFRQDLKLLDDNLTLLENCLKDSSHNEQFTRTLLARRYFKAEDLIKPILALSGGERVKAALCKVILGDYNLLLLDEPTNYLDIFSLEALEDALKSYQGTIIFVSHDRRFVSNIADHVIAVEDKKLVCFDGGYEDYIHSKNKPQLSQTQNIELQQKMLLENRMNFILGRLSAPAKGDNRDALEQEYQSIVAQLKKVK